MGDEKQLSFIFADMADQLIRNGEIGDVIVAFIDGSNRFRGSYYHNSPTIGDYETYITGDIVAYVDSAYRTIPDRESRGIFGFSMGGHGAMHLALSHPEVFSVASAHAGIYDWGTGAALEYFSAAAATGTADWEAFDDLAPPNWLTQAALAIFAGALPNPDNPPLYLDAPFVTVNAELQPSPELWERFLATDVMHDLERYLDQPVRLRAIQIAHGRNDDQVGVTLIEQAHNLVGRLSELGIEHDYIEHDSGHSYIADDALLFMAGHLRYTPPGTPQVVGAPTPLRPTLAGQATPIEVTVQVDAEVDEAARILLELGALGIDAPPLPLAPGSEGGGR